MGALEHEYSVCNSVGNFIIQIDEVTIFRLKVETTNQAIFAGFHFGPLALLECMGQLIGLQKNYRKVPYFMGKSMVPCRFSLKSTH